MNNYIRHKNYLGCKFGKLTIIKDINPTDNITKRRVDVKCDCGNILKNISLERLLYRDTGTICADCREKEKLKKDKIKIDEYVGKRYGKLVIIGSANKMDKRRRPIVLCKCDCGNEVEVVFDRFKKKHPPTHCGCNRLVNGKQTFISTIKVGFKSGDLEIIADTGKTYIHTDKHKRYKYTKEYKIWLCRCNNCGNLVEIKTDRFIAADRPTHCGCNNPHIKQDLTGKRFDKLLVVKEVGKDKYGNIMWLCKCDCGNEVEVSTTRLLRSCVKDCGCVYKQKQDLTGKKFDKVTVIKRNGIEEWLCKCDCGNELVLTTRQLKNKKHIDCGCVKEKLRKDRDLTGKRFGKLLVIKEVGKDKYLCKCDCGNEVEVGRVALLGKTRDCGCVLNDKLVGKRFTKLLVLERVEDYIQPNGSKTRQWLCKCDCGNLKTVREDFLLKGHTKSCGCTQSHGEEKLGQVLVNNNINYSKEKSFKDCLSDKGYPLRFDYYIEDKNCIIEYDGIQHFALINTGWDNEERYKQRIHHDLIKTKYCLNNGITLIRIPYTHRDTVSVEDVTPELSMFVIKTIKEYKEYIKEYKDNKKYYKYYYA